MQYIWLRLMAIIGFGCACSSSATLSASIIFDNGTGGLAAINTAYLADADLDFPAYAIDDFQLAPGTNVIQTVRWSGVYAYDNSPLSNDDFTIQLFTEIAGQPTQLPHYSFNVGSHIRREDTGVDIGSAFGPLDIYQYEADLGNLALSPDTTSWLAIFNNTTDDQNDLWLWNGVADGGNEMYRFDPSEEWYPQGGVLDFLLIGPSVPVPEPSAWLLFISGSCVFLLRARYQVWRA